MITQCSMAQHDAEAAISLLACCGIKPFWLDPSQWSQWAGHQPPGGTPPADAIDHMSCMCHSPGHGAKQPQACLSILAMLNHCRHVLPMELQLRAYCSDSSNPAAYAKHKSFLSSSDRHKRLKACKGMPFDFRVLEILPDPTREMTSMMGGGQDFPKMTIHEAAPEAFSAAPRPRSLP